MVYGVDMVLQFICIVMRSWDWTFRDSTKTHDHGLVRQCEYLYELDIGTGTSSCTSHVYKDIVLVIVMIMVM